MESDSQFLKNLNIMDYSLLLGIEKKQIDMSKRNRMNLRLVMELNERRAPLS